MAVNDLAALIKNRRTINFFKAQTPPKEVLLQALDLACWAPNHHLSQPWHFYLLGSETATAIAQLNARLVSEKKGAQAGQEKLQRWLSMPGWLVVTCDKSDDVVREREDYAACCCAMQNVALYLWNEGIGIKWTTGVVTRHPEFFDLIWVDPELESIVGMFWYGYPEEIPHLERKPLEMMLVELP